MSFTLGIDVGTSSTKALVCDESGVIVGEGSAPHPLHAPRPGWSEQDPADWWTSTVAATRVALRAAKASRDDVRAIGLSGQMHGSVFLDARGNTLGRALLWNDQRTVEECAEITKRAGGTSALIRHVNNVALTGYQAPKILWFKRHEPAAFRRLATVLLPKDYLRYRLTGDRLSEPSDASGTLLLDVKRRRWSTSLCAKLGLDPEILPRLIESTETGGALTRAAAEALGLREGTPVVGGAGDQPAGAIGMGVVDSGIVSATIGTSGVVFAPSKRFVLNTKGLVQSFCHAVPDQWCVFGCMLSAGASLEWLREAFAPNCSPADLLALAEAAPPSGLVFLPYLDGERCPHPDPNARGAFIGLNRSHGLADCARAVVEGVTYGMHDQFELLRRLGLRPREVRLGGGGARSAFWRQLQADVYAAPTAVVDTENASAFGAALLAGVGAGFWRTVPAACRAAVHAGERLVPRAREVRAHARKHAIYAELYPSLKKSFEATAAIDCARESSR